jgi:tetratricopeptide (TPR) repeat protein
MFLRALISASALFMLLSGSPAQIQGTDTLFRPSDLTYFSDLERESFVQYFNGQPDHLKMIIALGPKSTEKELVIYQDWISDMVQGIRHKKFERWNKVRKINQVKQSVSQALLISFEHQASFNDLFRYGHFNYFTAASLYAIILDSLDIPFEIREVSNSIMLLTYPDDEKIIIEINGPGTQFFMFVHDTRSNFVEFLRKSNIVDDATFASATTRALFERYYFANHGLTIREMTGMLYLNSAIDYLNRSEPDNAYTQLEKALILHPSCKTLYLLLAQLNGFLASMDYHSTRDLGYLIKAGRLIGFGMDRETIAGFLQNIIHQLLIEEQDFKGMQYILDYMQEYLDDEVLKKEFSFLVHYETGRLHFIDQQYFEALKSAETAYALKPADGDNHDLLVRSLGGYSINANPGMVLERINHYDTAFIEIADNELYLMIKQRVCLVFAGEAFQLQDGINGEHHLAIFEEIADQRPGLGIDLLAVGRTYSSAAIYYYRQGRIQKSREILEKGLEYAPHSIELKLKLKSFE